MSDSTWSTTVPGSRQPGRAAQVSLQDALAPGTRLDEFEIVSVLGIGAFGIVYLAEDQVLGRRVAIKEYMPAALAGRRDGLPISLRSPQFEATFERGLESFLSEARLLASFDHPSLVKVHRFWRANGTAYMAMQHYPGETLKDVRARMDAPPGEDWLLAFVEPLLDALELLHAEGVFHRDISPDNILILPEGRPVLLDFGSARRVIGNGSQFLSAVLKPPFAPVEQYANEAELRQGPWTDLYALGATLYFALLGRAPTPSVVRAVDDTLPVLSQRREDGPAAMRTALLPTIDWMLAMAPEARPRNVDSVRRALRGQLAVPPPTSRVPARVDEDVAVDDESDTSPFDDEDDDVAVAVASASAGAGEPGQGAASAPAPPSSDAVAARAWPEARLAQEPAARTGLAGETRIVVVLALLGMVALAGGAWTLNRTGPASPALASLAAALRAPASAAAARPAATPQPASRTPEPPRVEFVAPLVTTPVVDRGTASAPAGAAPQAAPAPLVESVDRARPRRTRHGERSGSALRPAGSDLGMQVQNISARTSARTSGSCDGLSTLPHMLCTLRECKSPRMSAQPKCVRSRQIEQARQRRMERE